jgi:hypothetical protein
MSTDAARHRVPLSASALTRSLQTGPLLPGLTLALLLVALAVMAAGGGLAQRAVPRLPSLPADGPPPRMASVAASVAC